RTTRRCGATASYGRGHRGSDPATSSPNAAAPRSAAMAGQMPAAASRRSRWRGPNSELTAPDGRSSPDATPRSPRASPTPSGCRGRAARPRTPASSPPGTGLSGSCDGGARYACTASANHRPRRWRQVHHPTPATYPCRTLPICAPTPAIRAYVEEYLSTGPRSSTFSMRARARADESGRRNPVKIVAGHIAKFKDRLMTPKAAAAHVENRTAEANRAKAPIDAAGLSAAASAYGEYQARLREANAADFGDLLLWPTLALFHDADYRARW